MIAADRHGVGDVGHVPGEAAVDIEPLSLGAGGFVAVIRPRLRLEKRNQRNLCFELFGKAAAMLSHEKFIVAQHTWLDAVGPQHRHKNPEEVGRVGKKTGQIFGEEKSSAGAAGGGNVLVKPFEVEKGIGNALGDLRPWIMGIGTGEQHSGMAETAIRGETGIAASHHRPVGPHQPQRHRSLLAEIGSRRMQSIAKIHLLPPALAVFPQALHPLSLVWIVCRLGPGLVERFQSVVIPHRTRRFETGVDLQLAGRRKLMLTNQRLLLKRRRVAGIFVVVAETRRQLDPGIAPQGRRSCGRDLLEPQQVDHPFVPGKGHGGLVRKRRDAAQPQRAILARERRGSLVADRCQSVEPDEKPVPCQSSRGLWTQFGKRREGQRPLMPPERLGSSVGECDEPLEAEISRMACQQFRLSVSERLHAGHPQIARVLTYLFGNAFAERSEAVELQRPGQSKKLLGHFRRKLCQPIELKGYIGPRERLCRFRGEGRKPVEVNFAARIAKLLGHLWREGFQAIKLQLPALLD